MTFIFCADYDKNSVNLPVQIGKDDSFFTPDEKNIQELPPRYNDMWYRKAWAKDGAALSFPVMQ